MSVKVKLDPPNKIRNRLDLNQGQKVQRYIDSECLRMMAPYVPHDTGELIKSGVRNTVIGSGQVEYRTPYARKMFFGNYNFKGAPIRGSRWDLKLINTGGVKKIIKGIKKL